MVGLVMQKIMMTSINDKGSFKAVSILSTKDATVIKKGNINNKEKIVIGFFNIPENKIKNRNKQFVSGSYQSEVKKEVIKEFDVLPSDSEILNKLHINQEIDVNDVFKEGDVVNVQGIVKGRGFTGPIKRHNFKGLYATHGVSVSHRSHGSTGCRIPARVIKGKKMAGRYGGHKVTVTNLHIAKIIDRNTIAVYGSVPGSNKGLVVISK